ncbi:MAG: TldD/PmbA family protein [Actinomycetota bacterium]
MTAYPLDRDAARRAAGYVLEHPGADGVEILFAGSSSGLTRYANSEIIQNTHRDEVRAFVRVHSLGRVASASTNQLDRGHMVAAVASALEAAEASPPDPDFPGLASPDKVGRPEGLFRWDDSTAATSPAQRADAVRGILSETRRGNASGIYETGAYAYAVISSEGVDCFDAYTRCVTTCLVDRDGATGWGEDSSHSMEAVDHLSAARRSSAKAEAGRSPQDADPGRYEVVLEASAVAVMIDYLSYSGCGAKQVIEGDSFLATRTGEVVAERPVTLADDAANPCSVGIGFDFEGVPRSTVRIIEDGIAKGPVTDLRTAGQLGTTSTGHSSGSAEYGPYASNPVLAGGDRSLEGLIAGVASGFLVTRFHYVNILDRPSTLLTGMTRDGTFRIERGEVTAPVHNFRFSNSVLDMLAAVVGIGKDVASFPPDFGAFGSTAAPPLHVGEFTFSSTTSH